MNDDARGDIEQSCIKLRDVKQSLSNAVSTVENVNVKAKIQNQLNVITTALKECETIAGGLSQF